MTFGKRGAGESSDTSSEPIDDFIRLTNFIQGDNNKMMREALKRYAQTQIDTTHADAGIIDGIATEIQSILRYEGTKKSLADVKRDLASAHAKGRLVSNLW